MASDTLNRIHETSCLFTLTCVFIAMPSGLLADEPAGEQVTKGRSAVEKGLRFLVDDAVAWRKKHECATCHHGTFTVWALSEAKAHGYPVDEEKLKEVTDWTRERLSTIDKPRDPRPGWKMVSSPAVMLATMAATTPTQTMLSADDLRRIADHLVRHQETTGEWAWSLAPAQNRYPPFFESDELVTRLAVLAVAPHVKPESNEPSPAALSRRKADAWLEKTPEDNTTQADAVRLLFAVRRNSPDDRIRALREKLLARQNADGGWGQLKDRASDAYATGQALFMLRISGVPADGEPLQKGVRFLIATQTDNGSWPMTPRAHEGAKPAKYTVPITYFGAAWGTMGLMRCVPAEKTP